MCISPSTETLPEATTAQEVSSLAFDVRGEELIRGTPPPLFYQSQTALALEEGSFLVGP
jgi:hypothetical protein